MDHRVGRPPESMGGKLVSSTPSCVAIGTLSDQDGESHIVLTDEPGHLSLSEQHLVFDGEIDVSQGGISVVNALNVVLLSIPAPSGQVRARVWVNHQIEPDRITVLIGRT